jgi:SHS2 domain-containing protein
MFVFKDYEAFSYYTQCMERQPFEEVEHTADWALKVWGVDLPDLFINAAVGMMQLMDAMPAQHDPLVRTIKIEAIDRESLLVAWLEELLFGMEIRSVTYQDIRMQITGDTALEATIEELPLLSIAKPIKAVTYNELAIRPIQGGLEVTIVFDV